jgi:glycosyltransferase involved in cell wall biosynthesis
LKIIQITAAYKPAFIYGGPTMSVAKLCEALGGLEVRSLGVREVEVLTTTANGKTELAVSPGKAVVVDGVRVTYFKRLTKDHTHFSPGLLWELRKEILRYAQNDKTIIHIHAWWNLVSILSCWVAKWYNVPVVLSPRGMLTEYTLSNRNVGFKSIIHSLIGKRLLSYCHIHATSEKEKEDILKFIKPKSITVIANLVELEPSSEYQVSNSDSRVTSGGSQEQKKQTAQQLPNLTTPPPFRLIFLSRIEEKKGLELLFEALVKLDVDWSLTIAGSGDEKYVESLKWKVDSLELQQKINWVGQVKNEDKFQLLAGHDLMVLTSYNENFANVVIESLSVGTAVLLSNKVGIADYVIEKNLGWITSLEIESIKETLKKSYLAADLRLKIKVQAPKYIKKDFDEEALVKKYINLYQLAINADAD